jgi:hypothetical protein
LQPIRNCFSGSLAFVFIFLLTVVGSGFAQVTFVIDRLPHNTPLQDTIYITGSFNGWKLEDSAYVLSRRLDGKYAITLPKAEGTIEYKFNRGGWSKWETDAFNNHKPNRKFTFGNGETVYVTIENWQDVGGARPVDLFVFYFFGVGILSLAFVYQGLSTRQPELNSGPYAYAKAGFGPFIGFNSAWGYWISAWIGNVSYAVVMFSALSYFFSFSSA